MSIDPFKADMEREKMYSLPCNFLNGFDIPDTARYDAMDWLVAETAYDPKPEIVQLALALFDRFVFYVGCRGHPVLAIAASYAVANTTLSDTYYNIAKNIMLFHLREQYTVEQFDQMVKEILEKFDNNAKIPVPHTFVERFYPFISDDCKIMSIFLSEVAMTSVQLCHFAPSRLAATACCLSIAIVTKNFDFESIWRRDFVDLTGYAIRDLYAVLRIYSAELNFVMRVVRGSPVLKKYANGYHGHVVRKTLNLELPEKIYTNAYKFV